MEFSRILEWVAVPFSRDLPNPGIEPRSPTLQADSLPSEPPGKPDFKQYWSGLSFPSPGDLSDPRIEPASPVSPALAGQFFTTSATCYSNILIGLPESSLCFAPHFSHFTSLVAQTVKHLSTMQETWVQSLVQEDALEKGRATHSSILAWRI